ncbi:hypothetical protein A2480_01705 [Candidatus Uhrbacteria bacterium RIFOXYC2_FULL_47_19]|uniref:Uncharacterized protein n=1 Tax=Candidatus Uhrbacteria bacterium RIFOXYC2_FULL_47_19 TaxID=1802424 RepID=A0A1F7WEL8_9BACT|nr:MAG: hypothetical protein A2480_01705 [Candidatus Uhrbacteria bacterium RIFOXYC2_FULL_47_19]
MKKVLFWAGIGLVAFAVLVVVVGLVRRPPRSRGDNQVAQAAEAEPAAEPSAPATDDESSADPATDDESSADPATDDESPTDPAPADDSSAEAEPAAGNILGQTETSITISGIEVEGQGNASISIEGNTLVTNSPSRVTFVQPAPGTEPANGTAVVDRGAPLSRIVIDRSGQPTTVTMENGRLVRRGPAHVTFEVASASPQ